MKLEPDLNLVLGADEVREDGVRCDKELLGESRAESLFRRFHRGYTLRVAETEVFLDHSDVAVTPGHGGGALQPLREHGDLLLVEVVGDVHPEKAVLGSHQGGGVLLI